MKLGSAKKPIFCAIALSLLTTSVGPLAYAQSITPTSSTALAQPGLSGVTDVFIGKNSKGPYVLSWKKIEAGSETIVLDGLSLSKDRDYTIDYDGGMLAFANALPTDHIARVTYSYKPGVAVQNSQGMVLPISIDVLNNKTSKFQMLGMYKEMTPGKADSGATVIGLGGTTTGGKTELSTTFLTTTKSNDDQGPDQGMWDRSGMKLGAKSSIGKMNLTGSFARAGDQFAGAKEYGLKSGTEVLDFGASMQASQAMAASMSFNKVEDVDGTDKGASTTSQQQKIVLGTDKTPKLTASRIANETVTAAGDTTKASEVDTVSLQHNINKNLSVAAGVESKTITDGGNTKTTDTQSFSMNMKPIDSTQLALNHTIVNTDSAGETQTTDVNLAADPSKALKLKVHYIGKDSDAAGADTTTDVNVAAAPTSILKLNMHYVGKDSDASGQDAMTDVNVAATPNKNLNINLRVTGKDSEQNGAEQAKALNIVSNPSKQLAVKLGYQDKESDALGLEQTRNISVETQPANFLKFSGAYGTVENSTGTNQSKEARVELKPLDGTVLAGGFKEIETSTGVNTVKDVSGTIKASTYVQATGSYKNRESSAADQPDSSAVKVALNPHKKFSLTGSYETNPENKDGVVQNYDAKALGVQTKIGSVGLTGQYTMKDDRTAGKMGSERSMGMNMPIFGNGKLTTGVKQTETRLQLPESAITYSLGYQHSIGSSFAFSLTGEMTQFEREQQLLDDDTIFKAEAKVGLKF